METIERARGLRPNSLRISRTAFESAVNEMIARGEIQDYLPKCKKLPFMRRSRPFRRRRISRIA